LREGLLTISLDLAMEKDANKWNKIVENDLQGTFYDRFE